MGETLREFVLRLLMSGILLEQNLTNNRKRRKKNVDVEKEEKVENLTLKPTVLAGPSLLTRSKTRRYESVHFGVVVVKLIVNSEE